MMIFKIFDNKNTIPERPKLGSVRLTKKLLLRRNDRGGTAKRF